MNEFYCDGCDNLVSEQNTRIEVRAEALPVAGKERILVEANVRICNTCNEEVYDGVLMDETLNAAYAIYRERHNIITTDEIKVLQSTHDLVALLGCDERTVARYELGSIPTDEHNRILRAAQSKQ